MGDSDTLATLEKRKSRWDKVVGGLKFALGIYAVSVLTFLAVQGIVAQQQMATVLKQVEDTTAQVRESQLANQTTGTENHEKTRAYIKCLFTEVLTVPLAERTEVDFDTCTRQVDTESKNTDTQPGSNNAQPQATPTPNQSTGTRPSEPVATAPPDPEEEEATEELTTLQKLPVVGGLFQLLGL